MDFDYGSFHMDERGKPVVDRVVHITGCVCPGYNVTLADGRQIIIEPRLSPGAKDRKYIPSREEMQSLAERLKSNLEKGHDPRLLKTFKDAFTPLHQDSLSQ